MKTTVSVQARLGSTRLPGKVLLHLGPKRILEWVLARCEAAVDADSLVVAIGDNPENEAIVEFCERTAKRYVVGPEDDLLARHLAAAELTGCDRLVRVTADCPFLPPSELERVMDEHEAREAPYVTNVTEGMPIGTAVDVIDVDVLEALEAREESHPVLPLRDDPDEWGTVFSADPSWRDVSDVHIAVDTPTDYWTLTDALDAVGDDPRDVAAWLSSRE